VRVPAAGCGKRRHLTGFVLRKPLPAPGGLQLVEAQHERNRSEHQQHDAAAAAPNANRSMRLCRRCSWTPKARDAATAAATSSETAGHGAPNWMWFGLRSA